MAGGLVRHAREARTKTSRGATARYAPFWYLSLEHVLDLDRSCVDLSRDGLRLRLGGDWVKVEEPVAKLLREAVTQAGDARNSWLFPGRQSGDCLSVGGVQYYLREIPAS